MIVLSGALVLVALVLLVFGAFDRNLPYVYGSIGVSLLSLLLLLVGILQRRGELTDGDDATTAVTDTSDERVPALVGAGPERAEAGQPDGVDPTAEPVALVAPGEGERRPVSRRVAPAAPAPEAGVVAPVRESGPDVVEADELQEQHGDVEDEAVEQEAVEQEPVEQEPVEQDVVEQEPVDEDFVEDDSSEQDAVDEDDGFEQAELETGSGVTVLVVSGRPRYHLEGCRVLRGKEPQPLDRDDARTHGFSPCGVCKPDADEAAPGAAPELGSGPSFTETIFGEALFTDRPADRPSTDHPERVGTSELPDRPVQPVLPGVEPAAAVGPPDGTDVGAPADLQGDDPVDAPEDRTTPASVPVDGVTPRSHGDDNPPALLHGDDPADEPAPALVTVSEEPVLPEADASHDDLEQPALRAGRGRQRRARGGAGRRRGGPRRCRRREVRDCARRRSGAGAPAARVHRAGHRDDRVGRDLDDAAGEAAEPAQVRGEGRARERHLGRGARDVGPHEGGPGEEGPGEGGAREEGPREEGPREQGSGGHGPCRGGCRREGTCQDHPGTEGRRRAHLDAGRGAARAAGQAPGRPRRACRRPAPRRADHRHLDDARVRPGRGAGRRRLRRRGPGPRALPPPRLPLRARRRRRHDAAQGLRRPPGLRRLRRLQALTDAVRRRAVRRLCSWRPTRRRVRRRLHDRPACRRPGRPSA